MAYQSRVRVMVLTGAAIAMAAVACGDPYVPTNPYDPETAVQFTITGPETLFSLGEAGRFAALTVPAFSDTSFVWTVDTFYNDLKYLLGEASPIDPGSNVLAGDGTGTYVSIAPPLEPNVFSVAISVSVGKIDTTEMQCLGEFEGFSDCFTVRTKVARHIGYKNVFVTQRVTKIQLRCPDTPSCAPIAVGDSAFVWVDGFDALGGHIVAFSSATLNPAVGDPTMTPGVSNHAAVTYISRDSTVASATPVGMRVCRVGGRKPGSTWVVATRGALADSLQIVVH